VNILGIDLGSKVMAFAILQDGKYVKSWAVDLTGEGNIYVMVHNAILEALRDWEYFCKPTTENFIAFEYITMNFGWQRILLEIVGIVKTICGQRDIGFIEISPTTIKKAVLGIGNPPKKEKKAMMVKAVNEKFGLAIESHDEADSIGIAYCAWLMEKEPNNKGVWHDITRASYGFK